MPADFTAIQHYLKLCNKLRTPKEEAGLVQSDYKSQTQLLEPINVKIESIKGEDQLLGQYLPMENELLLPGPTPLRCTFVEHVPDQQFQPNNELLDLDSFAPSLYFDLPPVPVKTESLSTGIGSNQTSLSSGQVNEMIVANLKQEINDICMLRNIGRDPKQWTHEEVTRWFTHKLAQLGLSLSSLKCGAMNGFDLCMLTENDFNCCCPIAGSKLFFELQVWRNACQLQEPDFLCSDAPSPPYSNPGDIFGYINCPPSVPVCLSPTPSTSSNDSTISCNSLSSSSLKDELSFVHSTSDSLAEETEHKQTIHLWQFLKDLLSQTSKYGNYIKWLDRTSGIFKIEDSARVAKLWGRRKNRPAMNYDKLSRSIRQYYKKGIIKKTEHSKRLVYQFCAPYL